MVTSSQIAFLLSDNMSLRDYISGVIPDYKDVKSRLKLLDRKQNTCLPDHYYQMCSDYYIDGIGNIGNLICNGLCDIADEHLELRDNVIYVRQTRQKDWQELITRIPPLLLLMAFLSKNTSIGNTLEEIKQYYLDYILPNTKYTSLPHPYIPQIASYVKEKKGLHDLHIHLNGSTETDIVWQDVLCDIDGICSELKKIKGKKHDTVKELLEQETLIRSVDDYRLLLQCALVIRRKICSFILQAEKLQPISNIISNLERVIPDTGKDNPVHPINDFLGIKHNEYTMSSEGAMYILVFRYLMRYPDSALAQYFHFYLLILGLTNRLLVQQSHQYGFQQFQKFTVNGLRDKSEKTYRRRFFQLNGNGNTCNIRFMEGRFSPKSYEKQNIKAIENILSGWDSMLSQIQEEFDLDKDELPELRLIAHFIKEQDSSPDEFVRFRKLRYDIFKKARVLALMKKKHPEKMKHFVGVDAAASEFDTPPEIFAPSFRYLKRAGIKHFTYHAGEDFYHLIGGLRAIYEAIEFCEMSCGDRIGHAVAAGIAPEVWYRNVGDELLVHQGEYMDDLLFAYSLTIDNPDGILAEKIPFLSNRIHELSYSVYGRDCRKKIKIS